MTRVVFGALLSQFLLTATIRKHLKQCESEYPQVVETISTSLYVDDFIASAREVSETQAVTTTVRNIMSAARMDICKWISNSSELRRKWQESSMDCSVETETHGSVLKGLGVETSN